MTSFDFRVFSTETATVVDYILEQMDKRRITGSIFIDLKKAFDLVDHHCLLHKLEHYGIRATRLKWFKIILLLKHRKSNTTKTCHPV